MPIVTRRLKQKGDREHKKRIEAAVQAILPLGFGRDLIFNTIQHLLQVYGGQRGWAFIEEESYKLVVDTILEEEKPCSPEAGALDERATNAEHVDIDLVDVKLSQDKSLEEEDTEKEGDTAKADKKLAHQECRRTEQVIPTENQLYDISIFNENLTRKKEDKLGISNVCADGDGTLTRKRDIGISCASDPEIFHHSSNQPGDVDRNVGLKLSDPLDDTSNSLEAEVVFQKGLYAGKTETESLEPSLDCSIDEDNRWQRTSKDKVQNSMLAGVQEGLEQRDNVDSEIFLRTSWLSEAKISEKKESFEEFKKHGKEHGERHFLGDLPKDVSSLGKTSEPCVIRTTTVVSSSQNTATNSCLKDNAMQEACQILPKQGADSISGSRGYADSSWTTSLPGSGLQTQEAPLYSSNVQSFPHRNSSLPLKRKACFGWLSDDESSPERSDTARLGNEDFLKVKETGSETMTIGEGPCSVERYISGKNVGNENNIMLSDEKRLPDKSSSESDCKRSEEDTRRIAGCLVRPWMNLSKDMGDKCIKDKYEQTEAGKSVQKILAKLRHENEIYDKANCRLGKLPMDESIGGSRLIEASHKLQSSHDGHETYRSDHRNSRIDGKHSWQPTNNNFSYNEKTSPRSLRDYQRGEARRKDWDNQVRNISKKHLEQGISRNREANFCEGHYRQEDERNLEKAKIISSNKKETDDQDYGREKGKESVKVISKPSLPHEKKGFQDPNNAHNHYLGSGKVEALHPPKKRKMTRWDVKPDFVK